MSYNYAQRDPRGWCGDPTRGAAMGRSDSHDADPDEPMKLYVREVRLDSGGYDRLGTYWGHGERLYVIATEYATVEFFTRARNREAAKAYALTRYPKASFFR